MRAKSSPGLAASRVHGNERPVAHKIRTFKETSHWPFVTASACLGGPEHRRYLWGPAAGASVLPRIWPQPPGPSFKGFPFGWRQTAPKFSTHAGERPLHPILPARPCVGAACVTGMGGSMGEGIGAGIFCLSCSWFGVVWDSIARRGARIVGPAEEGLSATIEAELSKNHCRPHKGTVIYNESKLSIIHEE